MLTICYQYKMCSDKFILILNIMTWQHDSLEVQRAGGGDRGDSAVSKHTTDSGLGPEATEGVILPGAVPRLLPPLRGDNKYERNLQ